MSFQHSCKVVKLIRLSEQSDLSCQKCAENPTKGSKIVGKIRLKLSRMSEKCAKKSTKVSKNVGKIRQIRLYLSPTKDRFDRIKVGQFPTTLLKKVGHFDPGGIWSNIARHKCSLETLVEITYSSGKSIKSLKLFPTIIVITKKIRSSVGRIGVPNAGTKIGSTRK